MSELQKKLITDISFEAYQDISPHVPEFPNLRTVTFHSYSEEISGVDGDFEQIISSKPIVNLLKIIKNGPQIESLDWRYEIAIKRVNIDELIFKKWQHGGAPKTWQVRHSF